MPNDDKKPMTLPEAEYAKRRLKKPRRIPVKPELRTQHESKIGNGFDRLKRQQKRGALLDSMHH